LCTEFSAIIQEYWNLTSTWASIIFNRNLKLKKNKILQTQTKPSKKQKGRSSSYFFKILNFCRAIHTNCKVYSLDVLNLTELNLVAVSSNCCRIRYLISAAIDINVFIIIIRFLIGSKQYGVVRYGTDITARILSPYGSYNAWF